MAPIMANVSKLTFGAAIAIASIATPALAAREGKPTSAHHSGYITGSSQGHGGYKFVPVAPSVHDSGRLVQQARQGDLWEGGGP